MRKINPFYDYFLLVTTGWMKNAKLVNIPNHSRNIMNAILVVVQHQTPTWDIYESFTLHCCTV